MRFTTDIVDLPIVNVGMVVDIFAFDIEDKVQINDFKMCSRWVFSILCSLSIRSDMPV